MLTLTLVTLFALYLIDRHGKWRVAYKWAKKALWAACVTASAAYLCFELLHSGAVYKIDSNGVFHFSEAVSMLIAVFGIVGIIALFHAILKRLWTLITSY